jgi:hypothetical protein
MRLAHGNLFSVVGSDTQFFSGTDDGFGNDNRSRQIFRRKCAAAGVTISGRYYPQLCRDGVTLDPMAQASSTGDIKRKLAKLGRGCEGEWDIPAPEKPPAPSGPYKVADDIVHKAVREKIRTEKLRPTKKQREALCEQVRTEITPSV